MIKKFSERREGCAREEALGLKLEQLTNEHKRLKEVMVSTNFSSFVFVFVFVLLVCFFFQHLFIYIDQ